MDAAPSGPTRAGIALNPEDRAQPSEIEPGSGGLTLQGRWTTRHLPGIEARIQACMPPAGKVRLDASGIAALDTGGAWLLLRMLRAFEARGIQAEMAGLREEYRALLDLVQTRMAAAPDAAPAAPGVLERIGRDAVARLALAYEMLGFLGEIAVALWNNLRHPGRIRFGAVLTALERGGAQAIPIVALLSFLLGVVIAYQGGLQLKTYGANIFIVELVTLTMFREFGPMMTAIIVAGRTGSAYTAEIGTMQVTEEVDALKTMGIPPLDLLVLPKVVGLILSMPLLTLVADAAGVLGGMVMAAAMLDVTYSDFLDRIPQTLTYRSFLIGIGKAPVFAVIVALVGCFQGFRVTGSADSVGRHTTVSVVQSIFLVIVANAVFSVVFSWLGI
ncbi:MAG: ABC transporter permease [Gammaproteobacteria bacterium]